MAEKTRFPTSSTYSCTRCEFFDTIRQPNGQPLTICRRHAPGVTSAQTLGPGPNGQPQMGWSSVTAWPMVNTNDWCGEYRERGKPASEAIST